MTPKSVQRAFPGVLKARPEQHLPKKATSRTGVPKARTSEVPRNTEFQGSPRDDVGFEATVSHETDTPPEHQPRPGNGAWWWETPRPINRQPAVAQKASNGIGWAQTTTSTSAKLRQATGTLSSRGFLPEACSSIARGGSAIARTATARIFASLVEKTLHDSPPDMTLQETYMGRHDQE